MLEYLMNDMIEIKDWLLGDGILHHGTKCSHCDEWATWACQDDELPVLPAYCDKHCPWKEEERE